MEDQAKKFDMLVILGTSWLMKMDLQSTKLKMSFVHYQAPSQSLDDLLSVIKVRMILVRVLVKKLKSQRKLGMLELVSHVVSLAFLHLSNLMTS